MQTDIVSTSYCCDYLCLCFWCSMKEILSPSLFRLCFRLHVYVMEGHFRNLCTYVCLCISEIWHHIWHLICIRNKKTIRHYLFSSSSLRKHSYNNNFLSCNLQLLLWMVSWCFVLSFQSCYFTHRRGLALLLKLSRHSISCFLCVLTWRWPIVTEMLMYHYYKQESLMVNYWIGCMVTSGNEKAHVMIAC